MIRGGSRLGGIPRSKLIASFGQRRGRPWTAEEEARARALRRSGMSDADIGRLLDRSEASVAGKLGRLPPVGRPFYVTSHATC
jgi:hypothetical protein